MLFSVNLFYVNLTLRPAGDTKTVENFSSPTEIMAELNFIENVQFRF